ncbi:Hypothetical predicted protein, partial [Marmota monax]
KHNRVVSVRMQNVNSLEPAALAVARSSVTGTNTNNWTPGMGSPETEISDCHNPQGCGLQLASEGKEKEQKLQPNT